LEAGMSRTDKTRPHWVQESECVPWARCGGIWSGIHYWANLRERQARRTAKAALRNGDEPAPYKGKNSARWDVY